jgi:hypothetical protein
MLKAAATAVAARRAARFLPGGWVTVAVLSSPRGRAIGLAAARHGWRQVQKHRPR